MNKKYIFISVWVIFLIFGFFVYSGIGFQPNDNSSEIQNVFSDVNGDGAVDLILTGKVIMNDGSNNFPQPPVLEQETLQEQNGENLVQ